MMIIFGWLFLPSSSGFVTSTSVINMPPTDIFATAQLTGVQFLDANSSGAIGFSGYETVDPTTHIPTQVDLGTGHFMCTGQFSASYVDSFTIFIGASDAFIQGAFQISTMT
jgi:hypothetical protein